MSNGDYSHLYSSFASKQDPNDGVLTLLPDSHTESSARLGIDAKIRSNRKVLLDNPVRTSKPRRPPRTKLYSIPELDQSPMFKYAEMQALNELWARYITDLLAPVKESELLPVILKADLHGAQMRVIQSKVPSHIGLDGIVVQETKAMFALITADDRYHRVPKSGRVFECVLGAERSVRLYGSQLAVSSSGRSSRKFKSISTVEL